MSAGPARQDELGRGVEVAGGGEQMGDALLGGDAPDVHHHGAAGINTEGFEDVAVWVGFPVVGVDAVVDYRDAVGIHSGVTGADVLSVSVGHGDDRVGRFDAGPFAEARQGIAGVELVGLPRPFGLRLWTVITCGTLWSNLVKCPARFVYQVWLWTTSTPRNAAAMARSTDIVRSAPR